MKKALKLLVLVFFLCACAGEEERVKPVEEAQKDEETHQTSENSLLDDYIYDVEDGARSAARAPRQLITLKRAHEMYEAYQERFKVLASIRGGLEDASYGWHSIDFYKNYIAYLEQEGRRVNIPVSGLRFYYVAYPEDKISGEQEGFQTFIFAPTYYDRSNNVHLAFDPLHLDKNGRPISIHEIITEKGDPNYEFGEESSIANSAVMCGPYCPEK